MKANKICNVAEARDQARRILPRPLFDFVDGGASDEVTLRDNQAAYAEIQLLSRAAVFSENPSLEKKVLGSQLSMPIVLCPCGGVRLMHPDGDRAVARAASGAGVAYAMSTASRTSPEEVFQSTKGPLWFQLYFHGEREDAEALIDRVQVAGFGALFVTVDSGGLANLERIFRHRGSFPMKKSIRHAVHFMPEFLTHPQWTFGFARDGMPTTFSSTPTKGDQPPVVARQGASEIEKGGSHPCPVWSDIEWIRRQWRGPLVVKGIMIADDARRARDLGADGIVVSNHGGRQLDGVPASLRVLSEIKDAIGDQMEILIDGGIRRGNDIVKALALGADAAMFGRPYLYGLAAAGEAGVARILEIFRTDLTRALGQLGCESIGEINASHIDASQFHQSLEPLLSR